jgi:hypothetical protein
VAFTLIGCRSDKAARPPSDILFSIVANTTR